MDELTARAIRAYYVTAKRSGLEPKQVSESLCGVEQHGGLQYAVLRNNYETLAVYRVRADGVLRSMKRWPKALDKQ
jgi:hypothetical protein